MKSIKSFREQIEKSEQAASLLLADLRSAQQLACGEGPLAKVCEHRAFELLQRALDLRQAVTKLNFDLQP